MAEPIPKTTQAAKGVDGDGDYLSDDQEQEMGSNPLIADIPVLMFTPIEDYQIILEYYQDNTSHEITYNDAIINGQFFDHQHYYQTLKNWLFQNPENYDARKAYLNIELQGNLLSPKLEVNEFSDLFLNFYTIINGEKKYLLKNHFQKDFYLHDTLKLNHLFMDAPTAKELLYNQKRIYIEISDFSFQHPSLNKKVSFKELTQNLPSSIFRYMVKTLSGDLFFFSLENNLQNLIQYYNLDPHTVDYQQEENEKSIILTSEDRKKEEEKYRHFKREFTVKRVNGRKSQVFNSPITQTTQYLVSGRKIHRSFSTQNYPHRYRSFSGFLKSCSVAVRRISATHDNKLSLNQILGFSSGINHQGSLLIKPHTWLIEHTQNEESTIHNWELPALPSGNLITIGKYQSTCSFHQPAIPNLPQTQNVPVETLYEFNVSQVEVN